MKKNIIIIFLLIAHFSPFAQSIYSRSFGNKKNPAAIFLHGGPGYNCVNFEATTAQRLADKGFYVIVYDRRGEGRSADPKASFNFKETNDDINQLYQQYGIQQAMLIAHSFGGLVATMYASQFPEKVKSIVMVGAPVSLQETFRTIQKSVQRIYEEKKDTVNLKYLTMLQQMDSTSLPYSSYSFMHAMQNGFYTPKKMSEEARALYQLFKTDTLLTQYAGKMTFEGPKGFWKKEHYTMLNLTEPIKKIQKSHIKIYGLYGKEDGLYAAYQIESLAKIIGEENLLYFDNCSHNVFIDQQSAFLNALTKWKQ